MTTVADLVADASPTGDDLIYVLNDPAGTPGDRKVTIADLATVIGSLLGVVFVDTTTAQNVAGVKTFTDTPEIPDEAYGVAWNGVLEPPTKNAVYDAISGLPTLTTATPLAISIYTVGAQTFVDAIGSGAGSVFSDSAFTIQDNTDPSKQLQFQLAGLTAATTRTMTVPDLSGTLALTSGTQSISGKTLVQTTLLGQAETLLAVSATPGIGFLTCYSPTILNFASTQRQGTFVDFGSTEFSQTAVTVVTSDLSFASLRTYKNTAGSALNLGNVRTYVDAATVLADGGGAATAVTATSYTSYRAAPTFNVTASGTLTVTSAALIQGAPVVLAGATLTTLNVHSSTPVIGSLSAGAGGVVTTLAHYKANNVAPFGGGTIATMYGLSIDALSGATTNIGIRNASSTQYEPTARTIAAVGDSLVATATVLASRYDLTNSSGGSLTLTSTPTLPDGSANGQMVSFLNVGAQNIVIQDQGTLAGSNLRLSANTITLGPRDSIELFWSTGIGDWVQHSQTNVL